MFNYIFILRYERTTEDVKSMIKYAKLDERNLTQISQAIYYPSASDVLDKYKLLELNSHLLAEIQEGQTLCFKGIVDYSELDLNS